MRPSRDAHLIDDGPPEARPPIADQVTALPSIHPPRWAMLQNLSSRIRCCQPCVNGRYTAMTRSKQPSTVEIAGLISHPTTQSRRGRAGQQLPIRARSQAPSPEPRCPAESLELKLKNLSPGSIPSAQAICQDAQQQQTEPTRAPIPGLRKLDANPAHPARAGWG